MDFVAIDFETANSYASSACSVGLVRFGANGEIKSQFYKLIKPPRKYSYFHPGNINIHGIHPEDVADEPEFDYLWPEISYFIGDDFLVAHNASFDMSVLRSLLNYYEIEIPHIPYFCSCIISRKVWPKMVSHRLTYLSEAFGFDYKAHYALDDAVNCGKVFYKACNGRLSDIMDLRRFLISKGIQIQYLG